MSNPAGSPVDISYPLMRFPAPIRPVMRLSVSVLVILFLTLLGLSPAAYAQPDFTSNQDGNGSCDGAWTTPACWTVTGTDDNGNGFPDLASETAQISEDDGLQVGTSGLTVGSVTIKNTDGDKTNDILGLTSGASDNFTIDGSLTVEGRFTLTTTFNGSSDAAVTGGVFVDGGDVDLGGQELDVDGGYNNQSGGRTLIGNGGNLRLASSFTNNGSLAASAGSEVTFDGDFSTSGTPQGLSGDFSSNAGNDGNNGFNSVTVESGAVVNPDDGFVESSDRAVKIDGILTVDGRWGEEDAGDGTPQEDSELIFTGNTFQINASDAFFANRVKFNNGGTTTVTGVVFSDVEVSNGTEVDLQSSFTINGFLTVNTADVVDLTSGTLTLNGDANIVGRIKPDNGGVTFNSGGSQNIDGSSAEDLTLGNVVVSNAGGATSVTFAAVDTSVIARDLTLQNNTTVNLGRPLEIEGDFKNQGGSFSFTQEATEKRIAMTGGSTQAITTTSVFELSVLEIANNRAPGTTSPPDVTVPDTSEQIEITDRLTMKSGRLETNQKLTIRPGARVIYTSGNGDDGLSKLDSYITDDVKLDRTLRGSSDWINISPSVTTNYEEFLEDEKSVAGRDYNDLWIQGPTNSDVPSADTSGTNEVNLFYYEESNSENASSGNNDSESGWTTVTDMTDQIPLTQGHLLFPYSDDDIRDGEDEGFDKLIDAVGPANFEPSTTISLSATDQGAAGISGDPDDGWNLIANPYLNTIDWTGSSVGGNGVDSTNCCGVIYTYDAANDGYISHNGTVKSTGKAFADSGYVAPLQSFFVKATSTSSPSVTIDVVEDQVPDSTGVDDPFLPKSVGTTKEDRLISLNLELADRMADTHASFQPKGKVGFDGRDAYELSPPSEDGAQLEMYSVLTDGTGLAINNLPHDVSEEVTIPLETEARGCASGSAFGGEATMTWPELRNLEADWGLVLEDTKTNKKINLQTTDKYVFTLQSSTSDSECTTSSIAKEDGREMPPLPSPNVVQHPSVDLQSQSGEVMAKGVTSNPDTRFKLHVKPNAAIPVEMADFSAEVNENTAVLTWSTLSEQNNSGFYVQHKTKDGSFKTLDASFQDGAGTTSEKQKYRYRVKDLDVGSHTFRLKQVDTDGSTHFTETVSVDVGLQAAYKFASYPNPVTEQATVEFAVKKEGDVTIALYNTLGQKVKVLHDGTVEAEQLKRIQLETSDLGSGAYFLRMTGPNVSKTKRMTVVR